MKGFARMETKIGSQDMKYTLLYIDVLKSSMDWHWQYEGMNPKKRSLGMRGWWIFKWEEFEYLETCQEFLNRVIERASYLARELKTDTRIRGQDSRNPNEDAYEPSVIWESSYQKYGM
jgi:hypothetical protein